MFKFEQPDSTPPEEVREIVPVQVVSGTPPSSTWTTGWVAKADPEPAATGVPALKTSAGAEEPTLKGLLVAVWEPTGKDPSVAIIVYPVPGRLTVQPVKVTTPRTSLPEQPVKVAPGVPPESVSVTGDRSVVTGILEPSSTSITGWKPRGMPAAVQGDAGKHVGGPGCTSKNS